MYSFNFRVSHIDNEFLELYGGLQSHHEEKRQTHFMKRRSSTIAAVTAAAAAGANTNGCEEGPTPESVIGIDFTKEEIPKDEVRYRTVILVLKQCHKII